MACSFSPIVFSSSPRRVFSLRASRSRTCRSGGAPLGRRRGARGSGAGPAPGAAEGEHAGVVAGAVVVDPLRRPALLRTELEVVLRRFRAPEERADGRDLLGRVVVGGASDRELVVWKVVARAHERERLERLRGGAHEARQRRVARRRHHLVAADGHRVNSVHRFDHPVPAHLDDDRLAHAREPYVPGKWSALAVWSGYADH